MRLCAPRRRLQAANVSSTKIKKRGAKFSLSELIPTLDILGFRRRHKQDRRIFSSGFAAEPDHVEENATKKLRAKNWRQSSYANDVSKPNSGMESDVNEVIMFVSKTDGKTENFARAKKNYRGASS